MYTNVSAKFLETLSGTRRSFRTKLKRGNTEITEGFISTVVNSSATTEGYYSIGEAVSSYVDITMEIPKTPIKLEGIEYELHIGLIIDQETEEIEYVPIGLFTPQRPVEGDDTISFTAFDRINSKMLGTYKSELEYPVEAKRVLEEISSQTGTPIDTSNLPDGVMIQKKEVLLEEGVYDYVIPFEGYSHKQVLSFIAQLYAKNVYCDRNGVVRFKWYENKYVYLEGNVLTDENDIILTDEYGFVLTDEENNIRVDVGFTPKGRAIVPSANEEARSDIINANRLYETPSKVERDFVVDSISCSSDENTIVSGSGNYNSIQLFNPLMTQERLDWIYDQVKDVTFTPLSLSAYGNILYDLMDIVVVNDRKGNSYEIPVMAITQDCDGGLTTNVSSYGRSEQEAIIKSPTEKKIEQVNQEIQTIKNQEVIARTATTKLTARVETVEGQISLLATKEYVSSLEEKIDNAELLITPEYIVSTVTSSTTYIDDLGNKVGTDTIISSINQSAETIAISASKIDFNGTATFSSNGYTVENLASFGVKDWDGSRGGSIVGYYAHGTMENYVATLYRDSSYGGLTIEKSGLNEKGRYVLSFKFRKKSGTLLNIGLNINGWKVDYWYLDGQRMTTSINNNPEFPDDGTTHELVLYCTLNSNYFRAIIQPNCGLPDNIVTEFWDIMFQEGFKANEWVPSFSDIENGILDSNSYNALSQWAYNGDVTTIDGGYIKTGTIDADRIKAGSITADMIQTSTIRLGNLDLDAQTVINMASVNASSAMGTIDLWGYGDDNQYMNGGYIQQETIDTIQIINQAITTDKIAIGAISADLIQAGAITSDKIQAGAITAELIDAGAITADKIDLKGTATFSSNGYTVENLASFGHAEWSTWSPGSITAYFAKGTLENYVATIIRETNFGGVRINKINLTDGGSYVLSFKFRKKSGKLVNFGSTVSGYIVKDWYLDGKKMEVRINSNPLMEDDTLIHDVVLYVQLSGNTFTTTIQPNVGKNDELVYEIWDIMLQEGEQVTEWVPAFSDLDIGILDAQTQNALLQWCFGGDVTTIDGAYIKTGTIDARSIIAGTITADMLEANTIKLGDLALDAQMLINVASQNASSAKDTIDYWGYGDDNLYMNGGVIQPLTVGTEQLNQWAVTSDKIAFNAITAQHIETGSITADKLDLYGMATFMSNGFTIENLATFGSKSWSDTQTGTIGTYNATGKLSNYVVTLTRNNNYGGLTISKSGLTNKGKYVLSFKFRKKSGTFKKLGCNINGWTVNKWYMDGKKMTSALNSNPPVADDTTIHEIIVYLTLNATSFYTIIQPNTGLGDSIITEIWDIMLQSGTQATQWVPATSDINNGLLDSLSSNVMAQWASASDITLIDGGKILTGSITADKLNVNDLSALNATIGGYTVTSNQIKSTNYDNEEVIIEAGRIITKEPDGAVDFYSSMSGGRIAFYATSNNSILANLFKYTTVVENYGSQSGLSISLQNESKSKTGLIVTYNSSGNPIVEINALSNKIVPAVGTYEDEERWVSSVGTGDTTSHLNQLSIYGKFDGEKLTNRYVTTNASDIRLKDNVLPTNVDSAIDVINKIGLYQFDWKANGQHQKIGFIADYMETVDKMLVIRGDSPDDESCINSFYLQGYEVKAIQELASIQNEYRSKLEMFEMMLQEAYVRIARQDKIIESLQ